MPLQFQPYPGAKTARDRQEQSLQGVEQGAQNLGNTILAYKKHQLDLANHDLQMQQVQAQIAALKQEGQSKYGTGAPAPTQIIPGQSATDATVQPSADSMSQLTPDYSQPQPFAGQPSPAMGITPGKPATPDTSVPIQETPEQQVQRMGTESYGKLHPPSMFPAPVLDREGNQIGTTTANAKVVDKKDTYLFDPVKKQLMDATGNVVTTAPVGADIKVLPQPNAGIANRGFTNEAEMRKEFDKQSAGAKNSFESAAKALTLAQQKNAVGDTYLAYALTRGALGSGGRVTSLELQQAGPKLGNLSDKIQQALLGLASGQKFDDSTRQQIVDMVKQQAVDDSNNHAQTEDQYRQLARDSGLQPGHVVHEIRPATLLPYLNKNSQTQGGFTPDVVAYAQKHGITPDQAQNIKVMRGGK